MTTKKENKKEKNINKKKELINEVKKEESVRKIKSKNYLILGFIFIITLIIVLVLRQWYISYRNYQLTIPVLKDLLKEVTIQEMDHYIIDNPDTIIYIEVTEDENSRNVAKELKSVIKERNLANKIVYLSLSSVSDKEKYLNDFSDKYLSGEKLEYYPALVLFIDGKIEAYVSKSKNQHLNVGQIEQLFDEYELEGDN